MLSKRRTLLQGTKLLPIVAGNYTDPNPSRTKMIAEKKVKLKAAICK